MIIDCKRNIWRSNICLTILLFSFLEKLDEEEETSSSPDDLGMVEDRTLMSDVDYLRGVLSLLSQTQRYSVEDMSSIEGLVVGMTDDMKRRWKNTDIVERIEAFEVMLKAVLEQSESERQKMEMLKAQGRDKSATYRQYLGNRLFFGQLIALYKKDGLI